MGAAVSAALLSWSDMSGSGESRDEDVFNCDNVMSESRGVGQCMRNEIVTDTGWERK